MIKGWGVPGLLLVLVMALRPHLAGDTYPFAQGLLLIPLLVGLALILLSQKKFEGFQENTLPVLLLPWILLFWSMITLLWSTDPGQGVRESMALMVNASVFTIAWFLMQGEGKSRSMWIPVTGVVIIPVLASAVYQRIFGLARIRETLHEMEASGEQVADLALIIAGNRVFGGFLNPNMLAGFLGIGICLSLDLYLTASDRRSSLFYALLTGFQVLVLVLTGSFGGSMVAAAMGAVVLIVRRGIRGKEVMAGGVIVLVAVTGILIIRGGNFLFGPESSFIQRGGYMAAGIRMALQNPVVGWGAGAGPGALMGFVNEGVRPVADPHNFLIRTWISWGLPGLILLVGFLYFWTRAVIRTFAAHGRTGVRAGYAGLVFGSAAFIVHSMLDMDLFVPETSLFGWCALGAAAGLSAAGHKVEQAGWLLPGSRVRLVSGAAVLALVLPAFVFLQGESLAFRAAKAAADGDHDAAVSLYQEARGLLPMNGRFALDEGRAWFEAGDNARARELFNRADTLMRASPYPSWELGRTAQASGDWAGSIPLLEKALSRYGTSPRIRVDLARAHLSQGEAGQVYRLLREARRLSMFDPRTGEIVNGILAEMDR